jgi:hypothetical protein
MIAAMRSKIRSLLLPLALALVAALGALLPLGPAWDPAYRFLLGFRPPLLALREPLIIDSPLGTTLSPGRLATILESLSEFGSGPVIVDLPVDWTVSDSTPTLRLPLLRDAIDSEFTLVSDNLRSFWQAVRSGSLRPADTADSFEALLALVKGSRDRLLASSSPRSEELPSLVAALGLASPAFIATELLSAPLPLSAAETGFLSRSALPSGESKPGLPLIAGLGVPPLEVVAAAKGTGFSGRSLDDEEGRGDGRVPGFAPVANYEGRVLPQAALLALAERLGASSLRITKDGLVLGGMKPQGRWGSEFLIPLDVEGSARFDRPAAAGGETRRMSLARIEQYQRAEGELLASVKVLEKAGYLVERAAPSVLWTRVRAIETSLLEPTQGASPATLADLREAKTEFFEAVRASFEEKTRIDDLCAGLLSSKTLSEAERAGVENLKVSADTAFEASASKYSACVEMRRGLVADLGSSLCILGEEPRRSRGGFVRQASETIDPSGRSAAFLRAGLSGRFIEITNPAASALAAAFAGLCVSLCLLFARPRIVLAAGTLLALALVFFSGLILSEAGIWISPLAPVLASVLPGIGAILVTALEPLRSSGGEKGDPT